jgi:hypothetical protein
MDYLRKGREKEYDHEWYIKNKQNVAERMHKRYLLIGNEIREKRKQHYYKNPEKEKVQAHQWQINNRDKYNAWARNWARTHRTNINNYVAYKKETDQIYKLKNDIRKRIHTALKNNYKETSALKYIGCSIPKLSNHLEKQFKPDMNWKNHKIRGWHIDHIKPINKFDLTKESEIRKAFHYTNLQPLWAKENWKKK